MNKTAFIVIMLFLCQFANAQNKFYINPNIGAAWSFYENTNSSITGNGNPGAGNGDYYLALLAGYAINKQWIIESGVQYHDALNRYYWDKSDSSNFVGGSFSTSGQGYLDIPINLKYNLQLGEGEFSIVPYIGATLSTRSVSGAPYDVIFQDNFPYSNDTIAKVSAYGYSNINILLNTGASFEYALFEQLILCASGNFTFGFTDINRVHVDVFEKNKIVDSGDIIYKGNKFYLTAGVKIPLF